MRRDLLLLLLGVAVLPAAAGMAAYDPSEGMRGWKLSRIAYCPAREIMKWTCNWCEPTFEVVAAVEGPHHHTQCFVGVDHGAEEVVVAFRGSRNLRNWMDNLHIFGMTPWQPVQGEVHKGTLDGYLDMTDELLPLVHNLTASYPSYQVALFGHSLGGAQATLAAAQLAQWYPVHAYTYGSPRVGDGDFVDFFNGLANIEQVERVVNDRDAVPSLPARILGFRHVGREVWFEDGYPEYVTCRYPGEDWSCSRGNFRHSAKDHLYYYDLREAPDCVSDMSKCDNDIEDTLSTEINVDAGQSATLQADCPDGHYVTVSAFVFADRTWSCPTNVDFTVTLSQGGANTDVEIFEEHCAEVVYEEFSSSSVQALLTCTNSVCSCDFSYDWSFSCRALPVGCQLTSWDDWTPCSAACSGGTQRRTREIAVAAEHDGRPCDALSEERACNEHACRAWIYS